MSCSAPVLPPRLDRDVVVDPIGRRARLVDDDAPQRQRDEGDCRGEEEEDERHREPARQPHALQVAHERVEQERDHRRGEKQEEDVPERCPRASRRSGARRASPTS